MNYTENYHLPQWDETDRVLRTDFNQMCADIEAGLNDAAAGTAEAAASAANAQATANTAVANAAAAQAAANAAYSPTNLPYAVGTYTGTGKNLTVNVGFLPRFVLISRADGQNTYEYIVAAGTGVGSTRLDFTSTGFTVKPEYVSGSAVQMPYVNSTGVKYTYIAFR